MLSRLAFTLVFTGVLLTGCAGTSPDPPPHVILIFADDLGYGDLGAYGQELIATPELDALAASGVRLTQFYTGAAVCSPARSALLQGRDCGHTYIRRNGEFPADLDVLPRRLQDAGYTTAMFGKWGMGAHDGEMVTVGDPMDAGFDFFVGAMTHRDAHAYFLDSPSEPPGTPEHPYYDDLFQSLWRIEGGRTVPFSIAPDRYTHDEYVDQALAFIAAHAQDEAPFFLYLPLTIPHAELVSPPDAPGEHLLGQYLDAEGRSIFPETPWTPLSGKFLRHNEMPRATYAAMVSRLSRDVGRIVDELTARGIAERAIVIFTSDNGPHTAGGIEDPAFFNSSGGLRDGKWQLTEGGIRVPAIIWGPGHIAGGRVVDGPCATWDLAPTIAAYAGATVPAGSNGVSLRGMLEGGEAPARPYLYWEMFSGAHRYIQAVRVGDLKALRRRGNTAEDVVELYDLASDPGETTDLAGLSEYCGALNQMRGLMNTVREAPEWNPEGEFDLVPLAMAPCCPGDVDGSGAVTFADLDAVLEQWGGGPGVADVDGNGVVDISDLNEVLDAWGGACGSAIW